MPDSPIVAIAEQLDQRQPDAELRTLIAGYIGEHEVAGLDAPVLRALGSVALERMMWGRSMGLSSFSGARDLFAVLGYNELLTYREYRGRYKRGGLANIVEKALGSVAKSGTSPIAGVLSPGERVDRKGLIFAATPAVPPDSITSE